jgi:hypothetical protein
LDDQIEKGAWYVYQFPLPVKSIASTSERCLAYFFFGLATEALIPFFVEWTATFPAFTKKPIDVFPFCRGFME